MTLGERIKKRRTELGLSQTELAEKMGLKSKVSISNAEHDKDDMTTTRIRKYAEALGVTPSYLMWGDSEPAVDYSILTHDEEILIERYRKSDEITRESVNRLLAYSDGFRKIYGKE